MQKPLDKTDEMKTLRYLIVYPAYASSRIEETEKWCSRLRTFGYDVDCFGIISPEGWLSFPKLDALYREKSPALMLAYAELNAKMSDRHVLIADGGSMLHPDFLEQLKAYTVLMCADDPESSDILSRPIAQSFDYCFPINIDCIDMYRSWGVKNVEWLFHSNQAATFKATTDEAAIRCSKRDIDIIMLCERVYGASDRAQRIEQLMSTFPQAFVRGRGWPGGYVDSPENCFLRSKIGWNLHNSTGPVNSRTYSLPFLGLMQICDNKKNLGKIYKLDEEVVGFDTLTECIEKTRYYLEHEEERLEIAVRGWKRTTTDYTEEKQWLKIVQTIAASCLRKVGAIGASEESMAADYANALRLASEGEALRAVEIMQSISSSFRDFAYVQNDIGALKYKLGKFEEALSHLRRADELRRNDLLVLRNLAEVTFAMKRHGESEDILRRILSIDPQDRTSQERLSALGPLN